MKEKINNYGNIRYSSDLKIENVNKMKDFKGIFSKIFQILWKIYRIIKVDKKYKIG